MVLSSNETPENGVTLIVTGTILSVGLALMFVEIKKKKKDAVMCDMVDNNIGLELYAVSTRDRNNGDVIIKLENVLVEPKPVMIELEEMAKISRTVYVMSGYGRGQRNVPGRHHVAAVPLPNR